LLLQPTGGYGISEVKMLVLTKKLPQNKTLQVLSKYKLFILTVRNHRAHV